jgi:hypothetical protein
MKSSINRNLNNLSDAEFDSRALHVVNSMTDNSHFPLLQDRIPAIKAAEEKFTADLAAAKTLGRQAVAVKNESRTILADLLNSLALHIIAQTDDVVLLVTTGFALRKKREPRVLTAPTSITLSAGLNSGEILLTVSRPKGAESFLHQICEVVEGSEERVWISTASTSNKHLFSNLQPGKLYAVRSGAVGSKGQLAFSPIATMYAQ